jgi:hypothetical protein
LKFCFTFLFTEGGIDETSLGVEAANVTIAVDSQIVSKRVSNSNADKLQLARPVAEQHQRLLPPKSFDRTRAERRKREVSGSNSGRESTSFEKGQRSFEVVSESVFAENLESAEHIVF